MRPIYLRPLRAPRVGLRQQDADSSEQSIGEDDEEYIAAEEESDEAINGEDDNGSVDSE